jgi:hypothetical protein
LEVYAFPTLGDRLVSEIDGPAVRDARRHLDRQAGDCASCPAADRRCARLRLLQGTSGE